MTIFPFLHRWEHTFSPSDYFFSSCLKICLGDYSSSVQKVVLVFVFFFFSFVIFCCGDVLVYCNRPLWMNMSLFPVFCCNKKCCDVHTRGSSEKLWANFLEAEWLNRMCVHLPFWWKFLDDPPSRLCQSTSCGRACEDCFPTSSTAQFWSINVLYISYVLTKHVTLQC